MAPKVRFGICTDQNMPWRRNVEKWRLFEELGFDSAWNCDHLYQPSNPGGHYYEAWTNLAGLAAVTSRIRIGCLVSCNTFRHPALLAKEAITVDHISGGRLEFGLGAGWFQPEHEMFGIPFPEPKELVARFREAVKICDSMFRNPRTTFEGRYYQLKEALSNPLPIQQPRIPFTLGAHGPVMMKIVAQYADAWNSFGTPAQIKERNQVLDEKCAEVGRDPGTIRRGLYFWVVKADDLPGEKMPDPWESTAAFEECIGRYLEAGVNEFIIDQPKDHQVPVMEKVAAELLARYR